SGSPFYLALEAGLLNSETFIEFGIQKQSNSRQLFDYIREKRIVSYFWDDLRLGAAVPQFEEALAWLDARTDHIVISFDLDAIAQAYAPGVSAPQAEGFNSAESIEMVR